MLKFIFSESFFASAIMFTLPILFASYAALISNKAGILNINIEGSMSVAALTGALCSHFSGSWLVGMLCAVAAGLAMSVLMAAASLLLKTTPTLVGIALNTLATGLCVFILYNVLGVKGDSSMAPSAIIPSIELPLLSKIPFLGRIIFSQNLLFYIAIASGIALKLLLDKTRLGTHIKAVGYSPDTARSVGISVPATQTRALLIGGVFTGLGGAYLSMAYLSYFSAGMVAGRGFIGLAAEAMGGGMPGLTSLFAFLFGAVDYFAVGAQAVLGIPYELLNTLPYIMTVCAMIIYSILAKKRKSKSGAS